MTKKVSWFRAPRDEDEVKAAIAGAGALMLFTSKYCAYCPAMKAILEGGEIRPRIERFVRERGCGMYEVGVDGGWGNDLRLRLGVMYAPTLAGYASGVLKFSRRGDLIRTAFAENLDEIEGLWPSTA